MKFRTICIILFSLLAVTTHAQHRRMRTTTNDTISSNYEPSELFSPMFYKDKGTEFHSASGAPGPKYWQNRVDYTLNAAIDTVSKTLSCSEMIKYTNNSPDALPFLWLQLDQNTYKADARSNFVTGFSPAPDQHTSGYNIKSVTISNGQTSAKADF